MSGHPLDEFLAIVRRDLGAEEAWIVEPGGPLPPIENHLLCDLPGGRAIAVRFAALPEDAEARGRRLAMLVSSFDTVLASLPEKRPSRLPPALSLQEELTALRVRAGALDALVIDARSPVVWGTAGEQSTATPIPPATESIERLRPASEARREGGDEAELNRLSRLPGVASVDGLWMAPDAIQLVPRALCERHQLVPIAKKGDTLVIGLADPTRLAAIHDVVLVTGLSVDPVQAGQSMLTLYARWNGGRDKRTYEQVLAEIPADERPAREAKADAATEAWARHLAARKAIAAVRALPELQTLHRGGHVHGSVSEPGFGYVARSFAGIYVLVLVFDAPFDELRAKRALVQALPAIERLVLALPPLDPEPRLAGVVALRGRRRKR